MRPARPDDAAAVAALVEAAFAEHVAAVGRRPAPMDDDHAARIARGEQWVADQDGRLVASVVLLDRGDHLHVENVAVAPDRRGRGLGRALLAFAEQEARRRGRAQLRLSTNAAMRGNLALYPHLGFREAGRRSEHGFARVFFVKSL